jgi:LysM repeat protein
MKIKKSRLRKIIKEALLNEQDGLSGGMTSSQGGPMSVDSGKPKKKQDDVVYKQYKIKKGDTLSGISKRYNIPMATLAKVNKIKNVDFIRAGDTLKMPVKKTRDLKPGEGDQDTDQHGEPLEPISNKRSGAAGIGRMVNRDELNRVKKSLGPRWDRMVKKYGESEAMNRLMNYMSDLKGDEIKFTVDGGVKKPETPMQKLMRLRRTKIK